MLRKIAFTSTFILFFQANIFAFPIQRNGDTYNGTSKSDQINNENFGSSPLACKDSEIPRIERETGTVARVVELASSGSKEGQFGRWLETNGYVESTGVCVGKPNSLILFINKNRLPEVNRIANEFFSGNSRPQQPSNNHLSDDEQIREFQKQDKKSFLEVCDIIFQQDGNFNRRPACITCKKFEYPQCLNLAQEQRRTNKLSKSSTTTKKQRNQRRASDHALLCALPNLYHLRLYNEPWLSNKSLLQNLNQSKAKFQSNKIGRGKIISFDEYSIDVTKMPYGLSPEKLLKLIASDLNGTLIGYGSAGSMFNGVNFFNRRKKGTAQLGELVDIKIPGDSNLHKLMSDDGTVQLVELESDHFTYQTVTTPETGMHPENGARTFGFRRIGNTIRFYTFGASRPNNEWLSLPGWAAQETGWRSLVTAIGDMVNRLGGSADFKRIRAVRYSQRCD